MLASSVLQSKIDRQFSSKNKENFISSNEINLLLVGTSFLKREDNEVSFVDYLEQDLEKIFNKKVRIFIRASSNMSSATASACIEEWIDETKANYAIFFLGNGDLFNPLEYKSDGTFDILEIIQQSSWFKKSLAKVNLIRSSTIKKNVFDSGRDRINIIQSEIAQDEKNGIKNSVEKKIQLIRLLFDFEQEDKAIQKLLNFNLEEKIDNNIQKELLFLSLEMNQVKFSEKLLRTYYRENPELIKIFQLLQRGHKRSSDNKKSFLKNLDLDNKLIFPSFQFNLNEIVNKTIVKDVIPVVIQMPFRSSETIRKILNQNKLVIYIDNEDSFKQAVFDFGYSDVFKDRDILDFGHLGKEGHKIFGKNISEGISKFTSKK